MIATMWLVVLAAGLAWWVRNDARQYQVFRTVEDSATRRRFYWRWTVQSFVVLVGASLVSLWLVEGLTAPLIFPQAFAPAHAALHPDQGPGMSTDAMLGMAMGMTVSIVVAAAVQYVRWRKAFLPVIGDIEPLLPRNPAEMLVAVPLSFNAGFSEELFFRCALPLLLLTVTGSLGLSFGIAAVVFGLAHAYQGWKGVAGTTVAGAVLTVVYLGSGSLTKVMAVHAAIDVVALIVRPSVSRWIGARRARSEPLGA